MNVAVPVAFGLGLGGVGNSPPEVKVAVYWFDVLLDDPPQASAATTAIRLILRMVSPRVWGFPGGVRHPKSVSDATMLQRGTGSATRDHRNNPLQTSCVQPPSPELPITVPSIPIDRPSVGNVTAPQRSPAPLNSSRALRGEAPDLGMSA